ncbi:Major facilitator superfamily domain general substrate transporter [Penicillium cf. griseofulvum]|nr:Major facilitator superfamily domain general substrate transporter [Penicillium cf. griseofulvum]
MASTEKDIARDMGSDIPYPSEKEPETSHTPRDVADGHGNSDQESLDQEAQAGVKGVQAAAAVWSKSHLILAYVIIWFIYFVTSIQEVVIRSLNPYVTSAFMLHSLTAATSIMANIIGGLSKIPLAKILDSWGRPQGMSLMLVIWVVGFIMMAACDNVQTYAAAQVFSSVGHLRIEKPSPHVVVCNLAIHNHNLDRRTNLPECPRRPRLAMGIWNIHHFCSDRGGSSVYSVLLESEKGQKMGLLAPSRGPLTLSTIKQYCIDVDLIGIILLAGGMALFLLPFSLWSYQKDQWRSAMIICMIIFGGLLLIVFAIYEKFWAPVTFIPFNLLMDRTVFFGGLMFIFEFMNSMIWGSYFSSMLQVVWGLDVTEASYVSAIYRVGSCLFCLLVGFLIRWTGRFKWLAVYFSFPLMILGVGLMIKFRQPDAGIGYICMTQIFVAFAGGTTVICGELAMMAPSDHQHIAVILAMLNLFGSIGSAIGSTVSAAIWTSEFPKALAKYVPPEVNVVKVYSDITAQLSYEWGSPARNAIARAYGDAQQYMLITSVCMLVVAWGCSAMWRDIKIKDLKQVKGRVI